ncbi:S28 family serine protease [Archangium primigenium]|uniref:S28 family serine protease n=1 Tax=[Archangium] primigenium TaxID=2792470 RepID=UPI0019578159|nr:S28 family serine protease [Archangium primigenium]MBM7115512.1 multidrug transporter [Archangium primigenium]
MKRRVVVSSGLCLWLALTACGGEAPNPRPEPGVESPDSGMKDPPVEVPDAGGPAPEVDAGVDAGEPEPEVDAGVDAGEPPPEADAGVDAGEPEPDGGVDGGWDGGSEPGDAGTDGGTGSPDGGGGVCGPSLYESLASTGDARVVANAAEDILVRLRAIPGMTVTEGSSGVSGYRYFSMTYVQPADHTRPDCQSFTQRLALWHTSDTAPMVLSTSGYYLSTGRSEPTRLLGSNQISIEHRFFPPSIPSPEDWSQLTIKQSADDFHRVVQALKPIYGGKWLSTGGSKGGETVVFFRRFYPQDIDGTVAYVAPIAWEDDERFPAFQDAVGGEPQRACRERIHTFQRTVLERRMEMLDLLAAYGARTGRTFNQLGLERALEHAVIETYFAFWQYNYPSSCSSFPGPEATSQQLLNKMDAEVGLSTFADTGSGSIGQYAAYYYQAAVELGWPQPYEAFLGGLIQYPNTDTAPVYSPPGLPLVFKPNAMADVQDWVSTRGERLLFIYGTLDPWSAAAYSLGNAQDSYLFEVPGGNHGASIAQLPEPQRTMARDAVRRWAGVSSLRRLSPAESGPQYPEFAPHLPPWLQGPRAP